MKTKEEILKKILGIPLWNKFYEEYWSDKVYSAMEEYKSQEINWDEVSDEKINESASKEGFSGEYRFGYAKGMKAMRDKIKSLINP